MDNNGNENGQGDEQNELYRELSRYGSRFLVLVQGTLKQISTRRQSSRPLRYSAKLELCARVLGEIDVFHWDT